MNATIVYQVSLNKPLVSLFPIETLKLTSVRIFKGKVSQLVNEGIEDVTAFVCHLQVLDFVNRCSGYQSGGSNTF